ncbi:MAG: hypothetical protein ACRDU0_08335, partial [Mycobacterium sp.]
PEPTAEPESDAGTESPAESRSERVIVPGGVAADTVTELSSRFSALFVQAAAVLRTEAEPGCPDEWLPVRGCPDEWLPGRMSTDEWLPGRASTDEWIPGWGATDEWLPIRGCPDEWLPERGKWCIHAVSRFWKGRAGYATDTATIYRKLS